MYRFRLSFFLLFSLLSCQVFGQAPGNPPNSPAGLAKPVVPDFGKVTGRVTDDKGNAIPYATVTLLRPDSTVVNGDLTGDNGSFAIAPTGAGNFRLRVESIGVISKIINVTITADAPNKDMGKIKLTSSETTLKSVDVVGEKPVIELKVDKKVFNVEKNITSAGGSASDVLQNVPAVSVDADGNVSLRGKTGVTILIDGKPATMLGTDVASALQSLPAGSIENVEVITNPSAKYDAAGTSGIINIVTKKDGRLGINGTATLGAGTRDKYNGNFGINLRKGKFNVFANASYRDNNTYNNVTTVRHNKDTLGNTTGNYNAFEHVPRKFGGSFNSIGASWDPDKYNSITVTENINLMHFGFKDYATYLVQGLDTNHNMGDQARLTKNSDFDIHLLSISSAVDYKHKFKKKDEELSFDLTYASTDVTRSQNNYTDSTFSYLNPNPGIVNEVSPASGRNSTFTAWADYTDPLFTQNGKLGMGFKSTISAFSNSGNPTISHNGDVPVSDSALFSNYSFTTQINAAYVNWSDQFGKFSYQLGLRVEQAGYTGSGAIPKDTSLTYSIVNPFPSAFISYQLANQQSIYLNYSRRTNYPDFRSLLPFKDLSNPGTVNMGNPNLRPEFIHNIEFSFSKATKRGDNIILSAYYSYTQNLTQRITRAIVAKDSTMGLSQQAGELLTQPVNIASGTTYGLEGTGHLQFFKWWDATVNLNFFQNNLVVGDQDPAYTQYLSNSGGFSWFGKLNTSVKLPKNFSIQLNANYESPKVIAQGSLQQSGWVDLAVRKNLWKNKATIVVNCADIFKSRRFVTDYNLAAYNESINRVKETRIGNITFTYRFGKTDLKQGPGSKARGGKGDEKSKPVNPDGKDRESNLKDSDDNDQGGGGGGQKPGGGKNQ